MENYKGYNIELNQYYYPHFKSTKYIFYNPSDYAIPIGTGRSIKYCKKQIDEKLTN